MTPEADSHDRRSADSDQGKNSVANCSTQHPEKLAIGFCAVGVCKVMMYSRFAHESAVAAHTKHLNLATMPSATGSTL